MAVSLMRRAQYSDLPLDRHRRQPQYIDGRRAGICRGSRTMQRFAARDRLAGRRGVAGAPPHWDRARRAAVRVSGQRGSNRARAVVALELPAGRVVALVGHNGAGKTTLVKLLCGMYPPTVGPHPPLRRRPRPVFDVDEWRGRSTAAFQDFVRFQFRLRESVGVGELPGGSTIGTWSAQRSGARGPSAPRARASRRPRDPRVGNRYTAGQELSGGQWQRLALARGLMRQAAAAGRARRAHRQPRRRQPRRRCSRATP